MGVSATWGGGNGDWFIPGNWTEPNADGSINVQHNVPTAGDYAVFNDASAFTVTYNGTDSVEGIYGNQYLTLDIEGGSLSDGVDGGTIGLLNVSAGATFTMSDSAFFTIDGDIGNAGTINLSSDVGDVTRLTIGFQTTPSPVSLTGGGSIVMSDSANNTIFINNDASLDNIDNTISGAGSISTNFTSLTNEAKGVIDGTGASNSLMLVGLSITNKGLIEDTGVGGLKFTSAEDDTSIDNQGGTISAVGAGAYVDIGSGSTISGGTLSSSGGGVIEIDGNDNFDGSGDGALTITAGSTVRINDAADLELTGASGTPGVIDNSGAIELDAGADQTKISGVGGGLTKLEGGGQIILSDSANNLIGGGDFGTVFENVDNTISGAGVIDAVAGRSTLTNDAGGTIDATGVNNALTVSNIDMTNAGLMEDTGAGGLTFGDAEVANTGGTISANGANAVVNFVNLEDGNVSVTGGTLSTSDGGLLNVEATLSLDGATTVAGDVEGTGIFEIASGDATFASGAALSVNELRIDGGVESEIATALTYGGDFANSGTVTIDGTSTFELSGAVSYNGAIDFASGEAGDLKLDAAAMPNGQTFADTIGGFGAHDVIDLTGLTFAGGTTPLYDSASGTLTVTEDGVTDTLILSSPGATNFIAEADSSGGTEIVCFATGSRIRTARGNVAVEALGVGDLVVTASGERRPIRWIGHRKVDCRSHPRKQDVLPVRICAHAFGDNQPARDLYVSPAHAICVDVLGEVLVPAIALVDGAMVQQVGVEAVTYWHVELASHDILLAENLATESYIDMGNRGFFREAGVVDLHAGPDAARPDHARYCRPLHWDGPLVEALRMQLRRRAESRGWILTQALDLHLGIDGKRIDAKIDGLTARFSIPAGSGDGWLISPTARPRDTMGTCDDRALGVCVKSLQISDGSQAIEAVALDDAQLAEGFHACEDGARRWTDGRAKLPAELWRGGDCRLTIHLDGAPVPRWTAPGSRMAPPQVQNEAA